MDTKNISPEDNAFAAAKVNQLLNDAFDQLLFPDHIAKLLSPVAKELAMGVIVETRDVLTDRDMPTADPVMNVVIAMAAGHLLRSALQVFEGPALNHAAMLAFTSCLDTESVATKAIDDEALQTFQSAVAYAQSRA